MEKTLVIVESPAKAKTIATYLGKSYQLVASVGHIRNLPSSTIGVDINNGYKPLYVTIKGKEKVVKELKEKAQNVEHVLIATDPDREGEAIAWHIAKLLKIDPASLCRVSFNEITKNSITKSINEPKPINMNLVNAQQARRILDRLVGYELSPLMWKKIRKGLSAGRVQSVATRMIVDREEEINKFVPEEYWHLDIYFQTKDNSAFKARYYGNLVNNKVKKIVLHSESEVEEVMHNLDTSYNILNIEEKARKKKPYAPYTTSTMAQDASRKLSFSSKKTMSVAQQLYEGLDLGEYGLNSLVTYIRTDSVRISNEALAACRELIKTEYGDDFLPNKANFYKNKNSSQDAHEAIRPAHFELKPEKIKKYLTNDQYRLYQLIWDRFLSSQMKEAVVNKTQIDIENNKAIFRVAGETIVFPGFLIVNQKNNIDDKEAENDLSEKDELEYTNTILPNITKDTEIKELKREKNQKFTQAPARYNEASLIKAMEEEGIGRPSTYAPTLFTIQERNYIKKEGKNLLPTELGITVTKFLKDNFNNIVNLKFTANLEERLDIVEEGNVEWVEVLDGFYPEFHELINKVNENVEKYQLTVEKLDEMCPECGNNLVLREGRYGKFVACSTYPNCKYTRNISDNIEAHCPLCKADLESRRTKKGTIFYVCGKNGKDKNCEFISWNLPIDNKFCDECGSYMEKRKFRNKFFESCSNENCPTRAKKNKKKTDKEE